MKKRILSMLLAIVMVVGLLPMSSITAFAASYDMSDNRYFTVTPEVHGLFHFWGGFVNSTETRHPFEIGQDSTRLITMRNTLHVILITAHIYLISV